MEAFIKKQYGQVFCMLTWCCTLGLPTQNEKSQTSKLIALTDRCSYNLNIFYISEVFCNVISSKSPVFQGQIGRKSKKYQVPIP